MHLIQLLRLGPRFLLIWSESVSWRQHAPRPPSPAVRKYPRPSRSHLHRAPKHALERQHICLLTRLSAGVGTANPGLHSRLVYFLFSVTPSPVVRIRSFFWVP